MDRKHSAHVKAVITDLDWTLLRADKTVSEHTVNVLKKCREKGILIMAATARPARTIQTYREQIGFDAITTLNGANTFVSDMKIEKRIPRAAGEKIISEMLNVRDCIISIETNRGIFSNIYIPEWQTTVYSGFPSLPSETSLYKILISGSDADLKPYVEKAVTEDTYYTVAQNSIVQIMSREATKWNGILSMLGYFGISPEETIYFGDDNDDIEPITGCGTGVAVSNAIEAVKLAADVITGSCEEDGVACYLEKLLL